MGLRAILLPLAVGVCLGILDYPRHLTAQTCSATNISTNSLQSATGYVNGSKYCFVNYGYSYDCTSGQTDQCNVCRLVSTSSGSNYGNYPNQDNSKTSLEPSNQQYAACGALGTNVSVATSIGPLALNTFYQTGFSVGPVDPTTGNCSGNYNSYNLAGVVRYNGDLTVTPQPL